MKLREIFQELLKVQESIGASTPFICGGAARDKYMGKLENVADLDITNGQKDIDYLSQQFAEALKKKYNITRKTMEDGHSTIFIGNLKMDFSSNFVVPHIDPMLYKLGIKTPTNMQREMYSRDFTCNALLMTLDFKQILDPTKRGFADIKAKVIRTCLAPEITLTSNRNRVVRAIYLACKLGFEVDDNIINYVKSHPEVVKISTKKSMSDKLTEAFERDPQKAAQLINKMGIWNYIPIIQKAYPYYQAFLKEQNVK